MSGDEPFKILPFAPQFQDGVVVLAEQVVDQELGKPFDLSDEADLQDIAASYAAPDGCFFVAVSVGEVVAAGGLCKLSPTDCELRRLYVRWDYRRQGVGSGIVGQLLPFVRQRGYRRIFLQTGRGMDFSDEAYARYGFKLLTDSSLAPRPGEFRFIDLKPNPSA